MRSLLRQYEQIASSATFDSAVSSVDTTAVAEMTVSGTLEHDLNVIRTLVHGAKGTSNWYDGLGTYTNPLNTGSPTSMSLENIKGHTLDAKTMIIAVTEDNSGAGFTVSGTSTGVLSSITTAYATSTNTTGLPIFASAGGTYLDEGGSDSVCRVDVLNASNDQEFQNSSGQTIYAKLHDGADFSGTGTGADVYFRFYANGSVCDLSAVTGVTGVYFVYPQRKRMTDVAEHEFLRTDFVSSFEGDVELTEDISNLWGYTGAVDGDSSTAGEWTNTGSYYTLSANPSSLQAAIDAINTGVGDRDYLQDNYISDGESVSDSLDKLDQNLKLVADSITGAITKRVESPVSNISKNTLHPLPGGLTYTPVSTSGQEGANMDVYVGGQLLAADTGAAGANADRDYGETTTSGITFRFKVHSNRNITYIVRQ